MKKCLLVALTAAAVMFAGCASMEVTQDPNLNGQKLAAAGTTVAHITADNWGLYFLWIPLITGGTDNPGTIVFSQDTVNSNSVISMVTKKSKELGGTASQDLWSVKNSMMLPFPIPFLFYLKSVNVSANVIK